MLRVVLDTNVLVSAAISKGRSRDLLGLAIRKQFLLIKSEETIEEFVEVLQRPRFGKTGQDIIKAKNTLSKTEKAHFRAVAQEAMARRGCRCLEPWNFRTNTCNG